MTPLNTSLRYGAIGQSLHWLTAIFVVAAYILGEGGPEDRVYSAARASQLTWHESCGVVVLTLFVFRIVWRVLDRTPEEPAMPQWMVASARLVHWLLYALLAIVPLTAIVGAWLEGHPLTLLGIGRVGPYLDLAHDLGRSITDLHTTLGNVLIWLAGFHALAALFHHYVLRDRVLLAMLPFGER